MSMEKYTVDIDKVLDDFEETEALKNLERLVYQEEAVSKCVVSNNFISNCKANSTENILKEEKRSDFEEIAFDSAQITHDDRFPQKFLNDETFTIDSCEKLNRCLTFDVHIPKGLNSTDVHDSNTLEDLNNKSCLINSDQTSKLYDYEIFYKDFASSDYIQHNSNVNLDPSSNAQNLNSRENENSSQEEILCISMLKRSIVRNTSELEVNTAISSDSFVRIQNDLVVDTASLKYGKNFLDFGNIQNCTEAKVSENEFIDKCNDKYDVDLISSVQQEKCVNIISPEQNIVSIKNCANMIAIENGLTGNDSKSNSDALTSFLTVKEICAKETPTDSSLLLSSDNVEASNVYPSDEISSSECSVQVNISSVSNSELDAEVKLVNDQFFDQNIYIEDPSDDEFEQDSGVSSQEDISGNSPTELNTEAATSGSASNSPELEYVEEEEPLMENNDSNIVNISKSNEVTEMNFNTLISSESSGNNTNFMPANECCFEKNTNDQIPENVTGARPKLENFDKTQNSMSNTDNIALESDNVLASVDKVNMAKDLNIQVEDLVEEASNKLKVSVQDGLGFEQLNVPSECDKNTLVDNKFDSNSESQSICNDVTHSIEGSNASFNCCEVSELTPSKADYPSRLQRPTTLNIPSRNNASEVNEETNSYQSDTFNPDVDPLSGANSVTVEQNQIGKVKPFWIPDSAAPNCMHCGMKFTVLKRRHHCRACGKVLCSRCCNLRAHLAYLNKEDRICQQCWEIIFSTPTIDSASMSGVDSQSSSSCGSSPNFPSSPQVSNSNLSDKNIWRPHPNNPDDYCSTIPPLQQIQLSGQKPPPTVMVPIGVLKRGNKPRREPKQVIFSDGIRPGGDLTDLTESAEVVPAYRRMGRKRVDKFFFGESAASDLSPISHLRNKQRKIIVTDAEGSLPAIFLPQDCAADQTFEWPQIFERLQDEDKKPVNFALMKNMHLFVKLIKLDCCFGKECWCFTSHGLCTVGQDEVMVILERLPEEKVVPRGILKLFSYIYDSASKGCTFDDLGHVIFPEPILGSNDHRGFLFVRPTFQCLSKLIVPNTPFLVAILIHKWEVPWAKVFPLRLMLRLGAECRYYPCSLVSVRYRKPVYFEIGQTIMSVLADLRNYQFTVPVIPGLVVHMEEKKTCVNIPRNRYEKVMKVLNSNNVEHVLALGSNFSTKADSHLVCMQKEEGDYQTQAINIENTTRRVTGASFIVFSGALKSSSGLSAKFSIVEDGLLVQIPQETMVVLHMALRDMRDLTINCGQINANEPEEVVMIQWTRDDKKFNIGVRSPIDGRSLEGVPNLRIHTSTDYAGENFLIRWTEVFFLDVDEAGNNFQNELVDPCRLAETIAQSCCMALTPFLDKLAEGELTKIGLRVTLDTERDKVEYDIGARCKPLPAAYMNALDTGLIPVILRLSGSTQNEPVAFELIFHILIK
ncbi:zinc finger FYVE domain-containing protein 9-like [Uloborus diversus]|uniref:zinc finger FYVE domain-containing protein 9-like n=1 Tax=Uloborus diversus TaxID=327109 RepID=UPI002409A0F3|nr:zinc finger FYVE domain-containing protein 9-like [Uloborus diversus]